MKSIGEAMPNNKAELLVSFGSTIALYTHRHELIHRPKSARREMTDYG